MPTATTIASAMTTTASRARCSTCSMRARSSACSPTSLRRWAACRRDRGAPACAFRPGPSGLRHGVRAALAVADSTRRPAISVTPRNAAAGRRIAGFGNLFARPGHVPGLSRIQCQNAGLALLGCSQSDNKPGEAAICMLPTRQVRRKFSPRGQPPGVASSRLRM